MVCGSKLVLIVVEIAASARLSDAVNDERIHSSLVVIVICRAVTIPLPVPSPDEKMGGRFDMKWNGMVCNGKVWYGMVSNAMVPNGMVWKW